MTVRVRFSSVSKRYRLGLTRTSLPTLLSNGVRRVVGGRSLGQSDANDFWALRDANFELHEGESLALVGRNGAGKTTILKLLANVTKPTSGTIETYGRLSALIELGAGFHPDLTGRENIYLNGAILGLNKKTIDRRFDEILDFSELEQFIDTPVKRYSSGMTVRLGFAVASCIEPDILLVDEVLAVGDASFQQKCMRRIRTLLENGVSIIFVSHNFYLVQAICNRALYLKHGEVCYRGVTQDVIGVYEQDLHQERAQKFIVNGQPEKDDDESTIEITRVEVGRVHAETKDDHFLSHEAVRIDVHYNAYRMVGKAHVSLFIMRSDGLTCCMMRTKLNDFTVSVEQGQGIVAVTLEPLQLVSGTYFVEAWFLNATDSIAITNKPGRSDWFTVRGAALSYDETAGIFEPRTHWAHTPRTGYTTATDPITSPRSVVTEGKLYQ